MGVVIGPRIHELELVGEEFDGVKVLVKGLTVGEALEYTEFLDGVRIAPIMTPDEVEMRDRSYNLFASRVVEWNLEEEEGVLLPTTLDGMKKLDWSWGGALVKAWIKAVCGVPTPLPEQSADGDTSVEASIPMEFS